MGHIQMLGKTDGEIIKGDAPQICAAIYPG